MLSKYVWVSCSEPPILVCQTKQQWSITTRDTTIGSTHMLGITMVQANLCPLWLVKVKNGRLSIQCKSQAVTRIRPFLSIDQIIRWWGWSNTNICLAQATYDGRIFESKHTAWSSVIWMDCHSQRCRQGDKIHAGKDNGLRHQVLWVIPCMPLRPSGWVTGMWIGYCYCAINW